ncbi:MAG TPA: DUF2071 domain-containing protein [Phycisphaerae bacterium]|nr:DUF2071 domain-containing protein [Phycisphaerae bacterium]
MRKQTPIAQREQRLTLSEQARLQFIRTEKRPFFLNDWRDVLMIHFRVDPEVLQAQAPFDLDLFDGEAYVSLIGFDMRRLRPTVGGPWSAALVRCISDHSFLNVRTYVRHRGERGIYFLAEWLPNRLSVLLGPPTFGLPYRFGRLRYEHRVDELSGEVEDRRQKLRLAYQGVPPAGSAMGLCPPGSLDEFVMERYTAFTCWHGLKRYFRIWHTPWRRQAMDVNLTDCNLLRGSGPWSESASYVGAHFSPGLEDIWMGRPRWFRRGHDENPARRTRLLLKL